MVLKRSVPILVGLSVVLSGSLALAKMSPRDIYKSRGPGVVLIVASQEGSSSASAGTGSILKPDGTIITNCHVIYDENAKAPFPVIHVFLKPDKITGDMNKDLSRHFAGELVAFDKDLDLAVLKIKDAPKDLTTIPLGDPDEVGPGDETVAIGHPEQGGLWTITTGVIGTEFEDFKGVSGKNVFQMETSLNRGNSGGPLFDVRGFQVGVNTAIARKGEGGVAITGVNFALKSTVVKKWLGQHKLELAYAKEAADSKPDERLASAEKPKAVEPVAPTSPVAETKSTPKTGSSKTDSVYRDPEGKGSLTVEGGVEQVKNTTPAPPDKLASEPVAKTKHKPEKFTEKFSTPQVPYTYKKLFTAVEKVRARAQDALDDLDREAQKRGR